MEQGEITREQALKLLPSIVPAKRFLERLRARMTKLEFPPDGEFFMLVCQADDAVQKLWTKLVLLTCEKHWLKKEC
jgi:hypothetical protein